MNAKNERRSDPENFSEGITGFGVTVEKIWNFEVSGYFLWTFPRLRTFLELLFKFQGPNRKIGDCGLIFEKPRGFFVKLQGIIDFGIIFLKKTHGPCRPGLPWTVCGRVARTHWSLASGRSDAQGQQPRGGGQEDGVGEPVKGLIGGRPTVRWPGIGGNFGGGWCASERLARAKREAKEGARRGGAVRGCSWWLL
jgi:hypothetical protein